MLPYQRNCDSAFPAPAPRSPAPGAFLVNSVWAIFFFSASASVCAAFSVASGGVGFVLGDGFGDALAKIIFFGEGLGVGFGFGFGVGFGGTFTFGVGFGEDIDAGDGFTLGN